MKELDEVLIYPDLPDHKEHIEAHLKLDLRENLINFLKQHHDCFTWSHTDMTWIDPEVMFTNSRQTQTTHS